MCLTFFATYFGGIARLSCDFSAADVPTTATRASSRSMVKGGGGFLSSVHALIMAHEQLFTYTVSFGSFYLFVLISFQMVKSPDFRRDRDRLSRLVHACVVGDEDIKRKGGGAFDADESRPESFAASAMRLTVCSVGIQVSYLLWGLMQERIMTKPYETGELFRSSKFLVFANRILALFAAWAMMCYTGEPVARCANGAPLYKFSYSSVSNIMSSVCQYEALKFVSFPTQVLAKSCKMVPTMLMGYVVSRRVHACFEYVVAMGVTAGAAMFKLFETNDAPVKNTELWGIILITVYMVCDSFTSNWQSAVFKEYKVSSTAMMLYANLFSSAFTALGLVLTLEGVTVYAFLVANPSCVLHIVTMAICSAVGQLFIFYTIKRFGPVVFATIQTVRQFLSVVLSILFFAHPINLMMGCGIAIVFLSLGAEVFHQWRRKRTSPGHKPEPLTPPSELESQRDADSMSDVGDHAGDRSDQPSAALLRPSAARW